jgi:DNA-binding transcriptional regulator YiaG
MTLQVQVKKPGQKQRAKAKPSVPRARTAGTSAKPAGSLKLRRQLQLSQPIFARLLSISVRSLVSLESGSTPTEPVARRVTELARLADALSEVIREGSVGKWLQTPNEAFDSLKPLEVIERGETDRIWSMIYFLRSGVPA